MKGWMMARGCNVSTNGVCFETALPLAIGEPIRIALINSEDHLGVDVIVRHVRARDGRYLVGASAHSTARTTALSVV